MAIEVVRFGHQRWRSPIGGGEGKDGDVLEPVVLLFDPRMERGARGRIGDRLRAVDNGVRATDLLIIRGSEPDVREQVERDPMLADRWKGRGVLVLCPGETGRAPELHEVGWSAPLTRRAPSVEELREAEILCGLGTKEAVYRQAGVHYLMPNTRFHADAFVRLGDSLNDQVDLMRLSDWLLPRVRPNTALLADNGSMLPLLSTLALRASVIHGFAPQIATLDEYPLSPTAVAEMVERLPLEEDDRLLCLVSVSSSGKVAGALAGLEGRETEAVIICETGQGTGAVEYLARLPVERWEADEEGICPRCEEKHLMVVSPRSYELRTAIKFKPEKIDIGHAESARPFWEEAEKADAVALHIDGERARGALGGSRHLAVWIDIARLLERSADFRSRCLYELGRIAEPELILIPEHLASEALRELAAEAFPRLDQNQIVICGVGPELPGLTSLLDGVDHALVIDDTLISGATLVDLRLAIHDVAVELGRDIEVSIFVPISRPSNSENERRVRLPVTRAAKEGGGRTTGLYCAQKLLLPEKCPWCEERALLGRLRDSLDGPEGDFAQQREAKLAHSPLEPPLLALAGENEARIVGSLFGELEPITAFAAVSAHAQYLHERIETVRDNETVTVLDVPFLLQAFFDPVIVAALLRTLPRRDLSDPAREYLVAREIKTNANSYYPATLAELALAALELKLPAEPVRSALEERPAAARWAHAYAELLKEY